MHPDLRIKLIGSFTQNLIVFLLSLLMLPIIATSSIYDGIFHQKFDLFKMSAAVQPPATTWAGPAELSM